MTAASLKLDEYLERFTDEPGYLDFARLGPVGRTAREEDSALQSLLGRARFGSLDGLFEQPARLSAAVAALTGFRADQVWYQPNASQALMQAIFGITGPIAMWAGEFPSLPFAAVRASDALQVVQPRWIEPDHGRVTPGVLRDQLTDDVVAVAVSAVDFRTGYLTDLEGIRAVIGDRLLIVDAAQAFGVVAAPFHLADVLASNGHKWARAGTGTGFLALSDRAVDALTPVFSGFAATDHEGTPADAVLPPTRGVRAFTVSNPDLVAAGRFAAALEELAAFGVDQVRAEVADRVTRLIDLADEFGIPVVSPRDETERAGIVVLAPDDEKLTLLTASLHNHGVTARHLRTPEDTGIVRLSPHVTTDEETFTMVRGAFMSFASAV
jgi:selenocysteine lyase/cysteine desulfurase